MTVQLLSLLLLLLLLLTSFSLKKNSSFYAINDSLILYQTIDTCDVMYLRIFKNAQAASFSKKKHASVKLTLFILKDKSIQTNFHFLKVFSK